MSDQTIKADAGKPRLSLVPTEIINQIARVNTLMEDLITGRK